MTTEADTRANYIDPALVSAAWESNQIIREYFSPMVENLRVDSVVPAVLSIIFCTVTTSISRSLKPRDGRPTPPKGSSKR